VQAAAAVGIGNLGLPPMCQYLIDKLDSSTEIVRDSSHERLIKLAGKDFGLKSEEWKAWCAEQRR
jgi:hypothetical protein